MISEFLQLKFTADDFLLTFAIMAGVMLILLILLIVNMVKTSKLKKKYESFMVGKDAKSLEDNLIKRINQVEELLVSAKKNEENIEKLFHSMKVTFQKVGMVKYDAFNEMGGKLSFSLALLDQKKDGFIINAVHSREGCYTYIKEIIDGNSVLVLSEEEKEALNIAMGVSTKNQSN